MVNSPKSNFVRMLLEYNKFVVRMLLEYNKFASQRQAILLYQQIPLNAEIDDEKIISTNILTLENT